MTKIGIAAFLCFGFCATAQQAHFDGKSWWQHVGVLAADNMEGRGTGTPGLQRAEAYVVDQLQKTGLAPAGNDGYYQNINFGSRQVVQTDSSAALVRNGKVEALSLAEDAFFVAFVDLAPRVEAPLVFLGYGIHDPNKNYNDFAGLELKGKVAVVIAGAPEGMNGPSLDERRRQIRDAGLIGLIFIPAPNINRAGIRRDAAGPFTYIPADDSKVAAGLQVYMYFNPARADRLFEGSGHTSAELLALAKNRKPLPRFALPVSIQTQAGMTRKRFASANVLAKFEGSDPKLRNEYVVLSAHIDHLGIGEPVNGDRIYNGALDNASGCAALLDLASQLKSQGARPRRSLLFAFFTGEELGHFGSMFFLDQPTVDARSIVADINIDVVAALVPMRALSGQGLDDSDLGDAARRAAASQNIALDSEPELYPSRFFANSDQFSFAQHGVPAVKPMVGFPDDLITVFQRWRNDFNHTPFDDPKQPVNLQTAGKFEDFLLQLLLDVANDPHRPEWKPGSIYKRQLTDH